MVTLLALYDITLNTISVHLANKSQYFRSKNDLISTIYIYNIQTTYLGSIGYKI